jgi:hypothetical protein
MEYSNRTEEREHEEIVNGMQNKRKVKLSP